MFKGIGLRYNIYGSEFMIMSRHTRDFSGVMYLLDYKFCGKNMKAVHLCDLEQDSIITNRHLGMIKRGVDHFGILLKQIIKLVWKIWVFRS